MHFLVHNSFLFTIAIMGLVHLTLLAVMAYAKVMPLFYFNILSVVVYLFCIILCKLGQILPVYFSLIIEVAIYAATTVYFIGWDSGAYCFLISIVPIIIYFGCFIFEGRKRWIIVIMLLVDFSVFTYLYLMYVNAEAVYHVSGALRTFLFVFTSFVMTFSVIFYNMIYIYSSESAVLSLERKNEQLTLDATEDVLTGLLNRRGFLPIVDGFMKDKTKNNFCIAFLDIDNFKRINDSYGHDCGDEVLRHIARIIKKEVPGCDICRWGGEEITILLEKYDFKRAIDKMEYLRKLIEMTPTVFFNKRIPVTVTIGLETYLDSYTDPESIIKTADKRMYFGKQHGKNILVYEDLY